MDRTSGKEEYSCVTRTGSSYRRGLPSIFLALTDEDYNSWFDEVVRMLLKEQDMNVFFLEPGEVIPEYVSQDEDGWFYSQMLKMSAIVIPVTSALFITGARITGCLLPFAREFHMPVLPLMMETGLHDLYKQTFGSIQFLSPYLTDHTQISFKIKLARFLADSIVTDKETERINREFSTFLFLSYRKKDRQYVDRLMRLLHHRDRYSDIAIWYDEYLKIGEKFDDNITLMLNKSRYFVLLVTPNLLEKENFVMREEYPYAKAHGKKILPVEMVPTEAEALDNAYPGIGRCIAGTPGEKWTEAADAFFSGHEGIGSGADREHLYYLGLAYLKGINVEVDHERALRYISASADQDFEPAMGYLALMYKNGMGVEADYKKAYIWYKKAYDRWIEVNPSSSGSDHKRLFCILRDMIDVLTHLREYDLAIKYCDELTEKAESLMETHTGNIFSTVTEAYETKAEVLASHGKFDDAYECLLRSDSFWKEHLKDSYTETDIIRYVYLLIRIGLNRMEYGSYEEAEKHFSQCIETLKILADETISEEALYAFYDAYQNLGQAQWRSGKLDEAFSAYYQGYQVLLQYAQRSGTSIAYIKLAEVLVGMGDIKNDKEDAQAAEDLFKRALRIVAELEEEKTQPYRLMQLRATIYARLCDTLLKLGDAASALQCALQSVALLEQMAGTGREFDVIRRLSYSLMAAGQAEEALGHLQEADKYYWAAIDKSKTQYEKAGTNEAKKAYFESCLRAGDTAYKQGDIQSAEILYWQITDAETEEDEIDSHLGLAHDICEASTKIADIYLSQGYIADARSYYEKAIRLAEELVQKTSRLIEIRSLATVYEHYAIMLLNTGAEEDTSEKVISVLKKVMELREYACSLSKNRSTLHELAVSYLNYGSMVESRELMDKAIYIWEQLISQYPQIEEYKKSLEQARSIRGSIDD